MNKKNITTDNFDFYQIESFIKQSIEEHLINFKNQLPIFDDIDVIFNSEKNEGLKQFNNYLSYIHNITDNKDNKVKLFIDFNIEEYDVYFSFFIPFESEEKITKNAIQDIFNQFSREYYDNELFNRYIKYISLKIFQKKLRKFLYYEF